MRLLLIRHGQTPNNVTGSLDTGYPGAGLTALGETQAAAVPAALRHEEVAAIYVSPLVRTHLTAAPLSAAGELPATVVTGLEEVSAGNLEMLSDPSSVQAYASCLRGWMEGDLGRRMPGGTTGHEFMERYSGAIRDIVRAHDPEDSVAVFSHGAAIRVFSALSTGMPPMKVRSLAIQNTGMSVLTGGTGRPWALESWHEEPLGGTALESAAARDVTGSAPRIPDQG
ncbi:histidine phosphatase family protein [Arthrobacter sp. NPDC092385]|uniref:histidine phosphatase family protein n=1 Tax=Arthrobacter sp. NPDC092385 TaxID=3363943 RepID=UPI0038130199